MRSTFISLTAIALVALAGQAAGEEQPLNLLGNASWEFSVDGGESFSREIPVIPAMPYRTTYPITARAVFEVSAKDAPDKNAALELFTGIPYLWRPEYDLNGHGFAPPLKDLLPNLPVDRSFLDEGRNTLTATFAARNDRTGYTGEKRAAEPIRLSIEKWSLLVLPQKAPEILNGPVIGAVGAGSFRLACQLTRIAEVRVFNAGGRDKNPVAVSPAGIFHNLKVPFEKPGAPMHYRIVAGDGDYASEMEGKVTPFSLDIKNPRFALFSDSQMSESRPQATAGKFKLVCDAIVKQKPDLVASCGDLVCGANYDTQWFTFWNEHFFVPAREMLASFPFYTVQGNHDYAPMAGKLFPTPPLPYKLDGTYLIPNWAQRIGPMLLIGIEGGQNWSPEACHYQWLEETLAGAGDAKFIFLLSHYSPWTSGSHGKLGSDGMPVEGPMRHAKEYVLPLLQKYGATAMMAGHDHFYERSEPPGGVTVIMSAGAGGRLAGKYTDAEKQNPHSKVHSSALNYSLFEVNGDVCKMTAFNVVTGEPIDTREWKARSAK